MSPRGDPKCAHCGALHKISWVRSAWPSKGVAKCVECDEELDRWDATSWPSYSRGEPDAGAD